MPSDKERVFQSIHAVLKAEKDVQREVEGPDSLSVVNDASKSLESETLRVLEDFSAELSSVLGTATKFVGKVNPKLAQERALTN